MRLPTSFRNNLLFLLSETQSQLSNLTVLLETGISGLAENILQRRGYATNLRMRIHQSSAEALRLNKKQPVDTLSIRAGEAVSMSLEGIIDSCFDCVEHVGRVHSKSILNKRNLLKMPRILLQCLQRLEASLEKNQAANLDDIRANYALLQQQHDAFYAKRMQTLNKLKHPEDAIESLFIANQLLQMGNLIISIAESVMSASIGQPLKLDGYLSLQSALEELETDEVEIKPIAETRSGSGISGIADTSGDNYLAIFKDGNRAKLKEEKDSVKQWHRLFPGLAPQILAFNKQGKNASLLIEYLPGKTYENIVLHESDDNLQNATNRLYKTLEKIWKKTRRKRSVAANHMEQLRKRLPSVFEIHEAFNRPHESVCGKAVLSLHEMIDQAEKIEKALPASFSVLIHGDFNLDNIMYDETADKIHFIDLHRSASMDYVQDMSVFMVSNYRLQVVDQPTRRRINAVCQAMFEFASDFANKNNDSSFQVRLTLGLIRSFITSTRFIMDKTLANNMYLRAVYLLEKLLAHGQNDFSDYQLPVRELFS